MDDLYHIVEFHRGPKFTPTITIVSSYHSHQAALDACPEDESYGEGKWAEYTDYSIIKHGEKLKVDAW